MRDTRETLQHELDEIRNRIDELNGVFEERPGYGLGRGDPAAMRREVDRALLRRLGRRAKSLERALLRFHEGSYGLCVQCGRPIHPERLEVLPDTELCVNCAQGESRNAGW